MGSMAHQQGRARYYSSSESLRLSVWLRCKEIDTHPAGMEAILA